MGAPLTGRDGRPADQGPAGLGDTATIPSAVRRTFKRFDTAPRDGTAFVAPFLMRFNPVTGLHEALFRWGEDYEWLPVQREPRWWCAKLPAPYEIPGEFGRNTGLHKIVARETP